MNMNTMDTVWLTPVGMRKLKTEYFSLQRSIRRLRRDIRQANLEFEDETSAEKRIEQEVVESRLSYLENVLQRALLLPSKQTTSVTVGSKVTYRQNRDTYVITLVNSLEADPFEDRISSESPLGRALIGKEIGDVAFMVTPVGERKLQIVDVK